VKEDERKHRVRKEKNREAEHTGSVEGALLEKEIAKERNAHEKRHEGTSGPKSCMMGNAK